MADIFDGYRLADAWDEMFAAPGKPRTPYDSVVSVLQPMDPAELRFRADQLARVFTDGERDYCLGMKHPHKHLAARFAAKEAVSKAFGTGIGTELGWLSVSVRQGSRGEPLVVLDARGAALLARVGATGVMVTLSHTETLALAVAALVRAPDGMASGVRP